MDVITRYFLRRFAQARRNPKNATSWVPYWNAALETSYLFIALPFAALFAIVLITSLRWPLVSRMTYNYLGTWPTYLILALVFFALGNFFLIKKFRKYQLNPAICAEFDSERDREIIFRQKTVGFVLAAIVIPLVALVVTFWPAISGR